MGGSGDNQPRPYKLSFFREVHVCACVFSVSEKGQLLVLGLFIPLSPHALLAPSNNVQKRIPLVRSRTARGVACCERR